MAIREGHGKHDEAERILSTGFVMLLFFSLLLTPLCFILKSPLLRLFGSSEATFAYADEYLSWYLAGTPFALLSTGMNSFVINQGMSRRAMASVVCGAVLNVALDPVFIFGFGLGVKGSAPRPSSRAITCS